jgi:beta-phosphoglucomutase-like phosphatase (HAD superfamily)
MTFHGVIFDFNGTLLWDTHLHNRAWDSFLDRHHIALTDMQKNEIIHGKNNNLILDTLFNRSLGEEAHEKYVLQKETIYQELCLAGEIGFAPGAVDFIGYLKHHQIPYAIATASGIENIDFYFSKLHLGALIERRYVIYNDHRIKSKPDPEIFELAIRRIGLRGDETVIFEDSYAGIESAERAGAGKIVIVNSTGADYTRYQHDVITDFCQVNRRIFKGQS